MTDKKAMKRRAAIQVAAVEILLRKWDPMGLAPGEMAPEDEYDSYAPHIVSLVIRGSSAEELARHLEGLRTHDTEVAASSTDVAAQIIAAVLGEAH